MNNVPPFGVLCPRVKFLCPRAKAMCPRAKFLCPRAMFLCPRAKFQVISFRNLKDIQKSDNMLKCRGNGLTSQIV